MKEIEKAKELYDHAVYVHGVDNAKQESLKSAMAVLALAPYNDGKMKNRTYWERVIEHLKKK
jgi:hypothetical protein